MRKVLLFVVLSLFGFLQHAMAQTKTVTGKVSDQSSGIGLPGVSVVVKGTSVGAATAGDGTYTLNVPANGTTLVFRYIGYQTVEREIGNQSTVNVILAEDTKALSEVLVVAYGTADQKSFTGSASAIKSESIEKLQVNDVTKALGGLTPGVQVVQTSGQPGQTGQVRIRGIGSLASSSTPLYVVDGAPYSGDLNAINPNDIESMTVLKDASAAALYGSRAANGVVVITTKGGTAPKKPTITFGATYGISDFAVEDYKTVNSQDFYELTWEALRNDARSTKSLWEGKYASPEEYATKRVVGRIAGAGNGQQYNPYNDAEPIGLDGKLKPGLIPAWEDDWRDALFRQASRQEYDFGIQGGSDKTNYYFSGNYLNQEGAFITSGFERYTSRLRVSSQVTDKIKFGVNALIANTDQNSPTSSGTAFRNVVSWGRNISSVYPIMRRRNTDGSFINNPSEFDFNSSRPYGGNSNPVGTTELDILKRNVLTWSMNAFGEITLPLNLKYKTTLALNGDNTKDFTFYNTEYGDGSGVGGRGTQWRSSYFEYTTNHILSYSKGFGQHQLDALGGFEAFNLKYDYMYGQKTGFLPIPGLTEFDNASTITSLDGQTDRRSLLSFLGQVNYNFADKYYLSASFRRDGSSRFHRDNRWGNFYSIGGSYRISQEDFMSALPWINDAKVRASYGTSGNESLLTSGGSSDYYAYRGLYQTGYNDLSAPGIILDKLENIALTWEKQAAFNVGVDATIFDRLDVTLDYYDRKSEDLLFNKPLANSTGFNSVFSNLGAIRNRGIEINLTAEVINKGDFSWSANLNAAHNKNEVTELPSEAILQGTKQLKVGQSIYDFYIQDFAGVDPQTGLSLWYRDVKDADGNVTKTTTSNYNLASRYYVGTALPDVTGGFTNNLQYKNFDLSVLFTYSIGGEILNTDYSNLMHGGDRAGTNWHSDILNRWQQPGDITDVPRLGTSQNLNTNTTSSRFLVDASYLRLRNVTLGYTLPKALQERVGLQNARVFVQGDNIWTMFKTPGLDPEQSIDGITNSRFPTQKTYSVGLRVTL
ncbi:SusC/RagA family TonB-linked outer membrane protein [Pontibacter sp. H249]|uniref:SusC/RagA family TonB-linked outer membrane protein n=1 Tax=Pontibacter sp. H249 TaxID=3133420 RepID=UPI0030BEE5D7